MYEQKSYRKFKVIFHVFILVFAISLFIVSITAWNEMNRALLYMILGIVLTVESTLGLLKHFKQNTAK